jgi:hypothetical protein
MKRKIHFNSCSTIIIVVAMILNIFGQPAMAQVPEKIPYQAVARNASGNVVSNQMIGLKLSIVDNLVNGTTIYSEEHQVTTNAFGLINVNIGDGNTAAGAFSSIDWTNGNKYVKVEMDINGGSNYVEMGTTPLLSVPFALHSKTAESVPGLTPGFKHYIGELFGGGIVFHVYKDANGEEHGLILSLEDLGTGITWGLYGTDVQNCESYINGSSNTDAIMQAGGSASDAAGLCYNYNGGGMSDWYLPALHELVLIYQNIYTLDKKLEQTPGATTLTALKIYWSSTEFIETDATYESQFAYALRTTDGYHMNPFYKNMTLLGTNQQMSVRAIRSF